MGAQRRDAEVCVQWLVVVRQGICAAAAFRLQHASLTPAEEWDGGAQHFWLLQVGARWARLCARWPPFRWGVLCLETDIRI